MQKCIFSSWIVVLVLCFGMNETVAQTFCSTVKSGKGYQTRMYTRFNSKVGGAIKKVVVGKGKFVLSVKGATFERGSNKLSFSKFPSVKTTYTLREEKKGKGIVSHGKKITNLGGSFLKGNFLVLNLVGKTATQKVSLSFTSWKWKRKGKKKIKWYSRINITVECTPAIIFMP